jgi:hypothetical protein
MSTVDLKSKIVERINSITDVQILEELDRITEEFKAAGDFWDDLAPAQKNSIEVSIKQLEEGKGIPHEQVMEEVKRWLKK